MTDFLTKYGGNDELLVRHINHDICEELLSLYGPVTMTGNDDLMDLLVKIVDQTGGVDRSERCPESIGLSAHVCS
ncbi:MAG: hypothetical protein SOY07_06410 [Bacteroidales bacterium]|nr:hypothetical protein [Bacteroidales bacterium]